MMSGRIGQSGGKTAFVALAVLMLTGCGGMVRVAQKPSEKDPLPPMPVPKPSAASAGKGSLWSGDQSRSFFFKDAKATLVGDIVTVRVVENAKGSKDAKTKSGRTSSLSASTASFLGLPTSSVNKLQAGANFTNAFDGNGATSRSGSLSAEVTAVVTAVYPNGNMRIEGRREVLINNEKEYLSISGVIRPEDIGTGNTVLSTVIADAKIEYSGNGVLNDKQRPGWLIRVLDALWPF